MKTTIIYPVRYRYNSKPAQYLEGDNNFEKYDPAPVYYAMNHVIAGLVDPDSEIDVLLVETCSEGRNTADEVKIAREEVLDKLGGFGERLHISVIQVPFASTKAALADVYQKVRSSIPAGSKIFVDLTYGSKYIPLIMFCVLNYAEKYLDCEVQKIFYGFFEPGDTPKYIVDFTMLYLLNNFGLMFDGSRESFDEFSGKLLK